MLISQFGHYPAARRTFQESFFDQKRLIHFFQCTGIFTQRRGDGGQSHRAAFKLIYNRTEYLIIYLVQSVAIDVQCLKRIAGYLDGDTSGAFYLGKIAHAA